MQPYFFPYVGYWQLMKFVDVFVVYDQIKFTKKGWIHRNRILNQGKDHLFSLALKKDSDFLDINQRYISPSNIKNLEKTLRIIENNYRKAPFYESTIDLVQKVFHSNEKNLFNFVYYSIEEVQKHLGIKTKIIISSELEFDNELKSQEKVIEICKTVGATDYINPIGGEKLYSREIFANYGLKLQFHVSNKVSYDQFSPIFIPQLSIIDVLMFNSIAKTHELLNQFTVS